MKNSLSLVALLILAIGVAPSAFAKKPKGGGSTSGDAQVFARYDKNGDGKLDADEVEAIKAAFTTDPDLKKFDTNGDGKLDENEIAAIKPPEKLKKKKKN